MASSKGFRNASDAPALPGRRTVHDAGAPLPATAISRRSAIVAAAAGIGGVAALTGCSPASSAPSDRPSDAVTGSTFAFDTFCTFTVYGDDEAPAKLSAACARYDKLFDLYDPASDIARVNDAGGRRDRRRPRDRGARRRSARVLRIGPGPFRYHRGRRLDALGFREGHPPRRRLDSGRLAARRLEAGRRRRRSLHGASDRPRRQDRPRRHRQGLRRRPPVQAAGRPPRAPPSRSVGISLISAASRTGPRGTRASATPTTRADRAPWAPPISTAARW